MAFAYKDGYDVESFTDSLVANITYGQGQLMSGFRAYPGFANLSKFTCFEDGVENYLHARRDRMNTKGVSTQNIFT